LSSQWKCGLCGIRSCPECHEQKGENHVCNPDQVATAKLMANDTKPCPKCQTPIYKIDGCDQMWCTQCHTAFSWKTGRTETVIHNPHYYEWMRKQTHGEIPRDAGCVPRLEYANARRIGRFANKEIMDFVTKLVRNTVHIEQVELNRFAEINRVTVNQDLRVAYLRGQIDEEKFKVLLQRAEKSTVKREEIRNILLMLVASTTDIVRRFESAATPDYYPTFLLELSSIKDYANEHLMEISKTYKSAALQFGETLDILKNDKDKA
jgi:hypothetical protein